MKNLLMLICVALLMAGSVQAADITLLSSEMNEPMDPWTAWGGAPVDLASNPGYARITVADNTLGGLDLPGGIPVSTYPPPWHCEIRLTRPTDINTAMGVHTPGPGNELQPLFGNYPVPGPTVSKGACPTWGTSQWIPGFDLSTTAIPESQMAGADIEIWFGAVDDTTLRMGVRPGGSDTWSFAPDLTATGAGLLATGGLSAFQFMIEARHSWYDWQAGSNYPGVDTVVDVDYIRFYDSLDSQILSVSPTAIGVIKEEGQETDTYYIDVSADPNTVDPNATEVYVDITFVEDQILSVNGDTTTPAQVTIVVGDGGTSKPVVVKAKDDVISETTPHTTLISHAVSSNTTSGTDVFAAYALSDVEVSIEDNDTPGITVTAGSFIEVKEGGYSDTYTIELESEPTGTVIVTADVNAELQYTDNPATFDNTNWNIPWTITVSAFNDGDLEGYHGTTITHTVGGTDAIYATELVDDVAVGIVDDEVTYDPNLVAMWKCEQQDVPGPGLTPSELGTHHGAYNGMTFGPGMDGLGLYGDADNDNGLVVADDGSLTIGTGDFTMTLWTMITEPGEAGGGRGEQVIAEKFQGPAGPGITCYTRDEAAVATERTLLLWPGTGDDAGFADFPQAYGDPYETAQGHHWAIVRDANEITVYLDGQVQGTKGLAPDYDLNDVGQPLFFGNRNDGSGSYPLEGGIDEIRFYNDALSQAEVITVMNDYTPYCGNYLTLNQAMDFDDDCYVGTLDLAAILLKWLDCTDPADPINCDLSP